MVLAIRVCACALVALAMSALVVKPVAAATFVYVSIGGDNALAVFEQNADDGSLSLRHRLTLAGKPGPLAIGPSKRFIYAAIRPQGSVVTLAVDPLSGEPRQIASAAVAADPVYLATDRQERFLFAAYYGAGTAVVYPIATDGAVEGEPTSIVMTDKNPHSIMVDPTNRYVYVPNTGADKVMQFHFDSQEGRLTPNMPGALRTGVMTGPRHFCFHPMLPKVYFVNEKGNSVTVCDWNRDDGTLAAQQTISTLPEEFDGRTNTAHIEVTPSGKFLYASNRGHDSLAMFAVDPTTGELTSLGQQPTEATPRSFTIDPSGQFLHAAGQASGRLASYRIDETTGRLKPLATYELGNGPAWVLAVALE